MRTLTAIIVAAAFLSLPSTSDAGFTFGIKRYLGYHYGAGIHSGNDCQGCGHGHFAGRYGGYTVPSGNWDDSQVTPTPTPSPTPAVRFPDPSARRGSPTPWQR